MAKKHITTTFKNKLKQLAQVADRSVDSLSKQTHKLMGRRMCLGITGLSRSGKSTFITSLINQLVNHGNANLPGFSPALSGRLLGVKILPLEEEHIKPFPYQTGYEQLTGNMPKWPESTEDISGCLLELRLAKSAHSLNVFAAEHYSFYLEIRDYPGEWLLDLPLREMNYYRWCQLCHAQYNQAPRKNIIGDLFTSLHNIDPFAPVDEQHLANINLAFKAFLAKCKNNEQSLSLIQPGRFLIPGNISNQALLGFIPLLGCADHEEDDLQNAAENSYFKICQQYYQDYVKQLVEPFYRDFFDKVDRQLVLIDVVNTYFAGNDYMEDMQQAISQITDSFSFGKQNALSQLINQKIDKVVFAATKIDQVLAEDHESVRSLLAQVVGQAYRNAKHEGVRPICEATAAVRSSKEINVKGERGISGIDTQGQPIGYIHPTISHTINPLQRDPSVTWQTPTLMPPKGLSAQAGDALPHIRIDTLLNELIGDKCE